MDMATIKQMIAEVVEFFKQVLAEIKYIFGDDIFGDAAEETTTL